MSKSSREGEAGSKASGGASDSLTGIIITDELNQRPVHAANHQDENEAMTALARAIATTPEGIFQQLADAALRLCLAGSSGLSLLDQASGQTVFRWRATAGAFASLVGQTLPRDFSPCGVVVDRDARQLMRDPVRHYPYIATLPRAVHEVLLVPFHHDGRPVGTLWVAAHDPERRFDLEDARIATNLAQFAAAAWEVLQTRKERDRTRRSLDTHEQAQAKSLADLATAQRDSRRLHAKLEAFFHQSPLHTALFDLDGTVTDVGTATLRASGYSSDDVLGHPFWETGWWRDSIDVQAKLRVAFDEARQGRAHRGDYPCRFADDSVHVLDLSIQPAFDEMGAVIFVIATGIDISARVEAERNLALARKRIDSALIAGELGTYEWAVEADRLYGDENFGRIFQVALDADGAAPLEKFLAAIHPEDRKATVAKIEHSLVTGNNYETDYRVVRSGEERWINARGRMVRDEDGRVTRFLGVVLDITARKRAEKEREAIARELRRLSAIHEKILSSTDDFAYVFDRQGRFLYANRSLLRVWAKTLDEIVGKTCHDLGYPTWHADMHMREIAEVIATHRPIQGEVPFTGGSGIHGIYDYIFMPVSGPNGEVELIVGTTRDVSKRREAEDRDKFLVELDDATRPLTESGGITHLCAQRLNEHLRADRCAYAEVEADENTFNLTGDHNRSVSSIVGRYRLDEFGPDCARLMREGLPFVVDDTETDERTRSHLRPYHSASIRAMICVPLRKSGRLVAILAVHQRTPRKWQQREIELLQLVGSRCWESIERTRVMRALATSEQQLRLAMETARLGSWEMNIEAEVLVASDQCKVNYGRHVHQPFTYEEFWAAVHPEDRSRFQSALSHAIERDIVFEIEHRLIWTDGTIRWMLVRGQPDRSGERSPPRIVGASLDITARKQAERELIRVHSEAVHASRAKDDFLAALSHELRTPLNPVLLLASESANDHTLPEPIRESFELIRRNVEIEARLIDDLLDLTSITRGKLAIRKQVIALQPLLVEAGDTLRAEFSAKGVEFIVKPGAETHRIQADPIRLLQVFANLLRNSIKFTASGGRVTVQVQQPAAGTVQVTVTDTGIGMTPEELARAFEPFEQGDHAGHQGSHRFGGLGLGLAIARQLVERHGGSIHASSAGRNQGTSVIVSLPLVNSAVEPPLPSPSEPVRVTGGGPSKLGPQRILLVEDHEATRTTLALLLRRRGYDVITAGTLAEAREKAGRHAFDVLISDLGLPDGDGAELMAETHRRPGVSGIAMTGFGMEQDVARCQAAGFAAHLIKPVRVEALEAAIEQVARKRP